MELIIREAEEKDIDVLLSLIRALSVYEQSEEYVLTNATKLRKHGFGPENERAIAFYKQQGATVSVRGIITQAHHKIYNWVYL